MADLKASLCGELPNQDSAIPQEQLRALLERRGIVGDPDIPNTKARLAEQELRRNMYHNTQVMLKHYRDIVWALECFPSEVAQELDQPLKDLDALLSVVDTQVALGNAKLEHRLLSIRKSRLLLDRINEALTVLRHKPGNGELMYNIIFQTFITPDKPSHTDILYRLDISERHYYRLRQQAGVPGGKSGQKCHRFRVNQIGQVHIFRLAGGPLAFQDRHRRPSFLLVCGGIPPTCVGGIFPDCSAGLGRKAGRHAPGIVRVRVVGIAVVVE